MLASESTFPYPRLPLVDAIRILTIEPGEFGESLNCSLTAAAFSTKPRYAALSYTWDFPQPDLETLSQAIPRNDASAPADAGTRHADGGGPQSDSHTTSIALTVNGHQFPIHANLWLCLMHLRSETYPLPLWVDAVCINQVDGPERNAQVAMMSFIYSRAQKVIAWLGLRDIKYATPHESLRILAEEWRQGSVQDLAGAVVNGTKPLSSPAPAQNTFDFPRIATSAYWTRLWIVQEACLARELVFVFGAKVWTFEDLEMWEPLKHARNAARKAGTLRPADVGNERVEARALLRIAEIRLFRHTDAMRFESLIERFANQACSEKRDRVYALLGMANDVRASIGDESNSNCVHSSSLDPASSLSSEIPELNRGPGTIRIDYSRQYYDIWAQVVSVLFFRVKPMHGRIRGPDESLSRDERAITIVRTAGVIQMALDGKVEQELLKPNIAPQQGPVIRALGYLVAEITQLGPDYSSLIGSFRAQQDWLNCCEEAYEEPQDLELIRTLNETYSAKIIGYRDKELGRIREIRNTTTVAWRRGETSLPSSWNSAKHIQNYTQIWSDIDKRTHGLPQEPKMCIATERLIALVPRAAEVGDVVVRFWNCDAALVMRRVAMHVSPDADVPSSDLEYWMLVGRCDVADQGGRNEPSTDTWRFYIKATQEAKRAVWIDLDLRTLQLLTASIAIYEH